MKIKSLIATAVIAVTGITSSFAATTLSPSASFASTVAGDFTDTWTFNLGSASTVAASISNVAVSFGSFAYGGITGFAALLNGVSLFNLASFTSNSGPVSATTQVLTGGSHVPAGLFTLNVSGNAGAGASYGGSIGAVPVSAVPEPETFAMLLAGLGLMGAIARRRNKSNIE